MNISSLNQADRAKAAVMIVAIVLVLVFVAHTILGALRPAQTAAPAAGNANANAAPAVPAPPILGNSAAPPAGGASFPAPNAATPPKETSTAFGGLDVHDPFVPLKPKADKQTAAATGPSAAPFVSLKPAPTTSHEPLPPLAAASPSGGSTLSPASVAPPPPAPQPQIRLVGLVAGSPSVATVEVDGRGLIANPGDFLAKGYRLVNVMPDGITVRHGRDLHVLHVGTILNAQNGAQGAAAQKP